MPVWGETIAAPRFEISFGGKGPNHAVAAAKLGADVVSSKLKARRNAAPLNLKSF
jgi:sugar/nucleoside kinase (ribokinase family)